MENWINYLNEVEGKNVIHNDAGFIAWKKVGLEMYVSDFFIAKEFRGKGLGLGLANDLESLAEEVGCDVMTCNVFINENNPHEKIRIFNKFGFKIISANNNCITMEKSLE